MPVSQHRHYMEKPCVCSRGFTRPRIIPWIKAQIILEANTRKYKLLWQTFVKPSSYEEEFWFNLKFQNPIKSYNKTK